jgi:hypothetical protein
MISANCKYVTQQRRVSVAKTGIKMPILTLSEPNFLNSDLSNEFIIYTFIRHLSAPFALLNKHFQLITHKKISHNPS